MTPQPPVTAGRALAPSSLARADRDCLNELRADLLISYPAVNASKLVRIARRHGLVRFPEAFLTPGLVSDRSSRGSRAYLRSLNRRKDSETIQHPLFSSAFYRLMYPDVAASSVAPWVHYQVFGRREGRTPHPLIDIALLQAALPRSPLATVVDDYLEVPENRFVDPGPYVDVKNYVLRGDWDHHTHPLVQLAVHPNSPWIHHRLMLIDSGSDEENRSRLVGAGYLLSRSGGISRVAKIKAWKADGERDVPHQAGPFTVVPGNLVARGDHELTRVGTNVTSEDGTIIRLRSESLGLETGTLHHGQELLFLTSDLGFDDLRALVSTHAGAVIAPFSDAQETALRQLRRDLHVRSIDVLKHGIQVKVSARDVMIADPVTALPTPTWDWNDTADAHELAVVLPVGLRKRATGDRRLRRLLARGASLCLVDKSGLNSWLPVIQSRRLVIVEPHLRDAVASFVPQRSIRILPPSQVVQW